MRRFWTLLAHRVLALLGRIFDSLVLANGLFLLLLLPSASSSFTSSSSSSSSASIRHFGLLCSTIVEHFSFTKFSVSVRSSVCHTTQNSPMYVTQTRILRCMSRSPGFSDVCHTIQNSPMYVTQPRILRYMSHNPKFSNVCH